MIENKGRLKLFVAVGGSVVEFDDLAACAGDHGAPDRQAEA
jgi:hypothetical protein